VGGGHCRGREHATGGSEGIFPEPDSFGILIVLNETFWPRLARNLLLSKDHDPY
jgi:hypothetical protein